MRTARRPWGPALAPLLVMLLGFLPAPAGAQINLPKLDLRDTRLANGLYLEADRMRSLNINQANLDNQRNAVQEERRQSIDNQPYGRSELELDSLAYDNFAYKHPTIGSMADLDAASVADVAAFFHTYYAPNNAVLTLVGDFDLDEAMAKVRKYFASIPA